jgi:uncharacterized protein YbcI
MRAGRPTERLAGGPLNCAIANAVVHVHSHRLGRGPTRAQAFCHANLVVLLLEDSMTRGERSLSGIGADDTIVRLRRQMEHAVRDELVQAVEDLTGRHVVGFLCDSLSDPDLTAELYVLDRPISGLRMEA